MSAPEEGARRASVAAVRLHGSGARLPAACLAEGLEGLRPGDRCVVECERGGEVGTVVRPPCDAPCTAGMPRAVREATEEDLHRAADCDRRAKEALAVARPHIEALHLPMKLVGSSVSLDGGKVTLFFTAEHRVDFRVLVRELAKELRARIELRQIGSRDAAGLIAGVGPCGRTLCCSTWIHEFQPISIKMAKDQGLSLTPSRISGVCGRLLCCLSYEHALYREARRSLPHVGARWTLPDGRRGTVASVNVLRRLIRVSLEDGASVETEVAAPPEGGA